MRSADRRKTRRQPAYHHRALEDFDAGRIGPRQADQATDFYQRDESNIGKIKKRILAMVQVEPHGFAAQQVAVFVARQFREIFRQPRPDVLVNG